MIDVSELVADPDFASEFQIKRQSEGEFVEEGEFTTSEETLDRFGTVQPSKTADLLRYLPEGERAGNFISVYCNQDVLMGNGEDQQSDIVLWDGGQYRVAFAKPWHIHGYWFAIAEEFARG